LIIDTHRDDVVAAIAASKKPDKTPERFLFADMRANGSLKLTRAGYEFLKDRHEHWSQALPVPTTLANYVFLIAESTYPYYIEHIKDPDRKGRIISAKLVTFDPMMGVSFKLAGGDFAKLLLLLGQ
jgi:hypothetical protein